MLTDQEIAKLLYSGKPSRIRTRGTASPAPSRTPDPDQANPPDSSAEDDAGPDTEIPEVEAEALARGRAAFDKLDRKGQIQFENALRKAGMSNAMISENGQDAFKFAVGADLLEELVAEQKLADESVLEDLETEQRRIRNRWNMDHDDAGEPGKEA